MAWTPPPAPTPFNTKVEEILFLDIETVPCVEHFTNLDEEGKKIFTKKFQKEIVIPEGAMMSNVSELWQQKAALYCEFSKIACVTIGVFAKREDGERTLRVKSFFGYNEKIILGELMPKFAGKTVKFLCAHNGKKFDFPILARKYVQHGIQIPSILNVTGQKPWEVEHFDTMEVWGFNDQRSFTSLDSLAYAFGLPSSKTDLDGSKVAGVYYGPKDGVAEMPWEDKTLQPIAKYCEGDVILLANVFLKLINQPIVPMENVVIV